VEETSYLTDSHILTVSSGIATTIGNYLSGRFERHSGQHLLFYNDGAAVTEPIK